jgi:ribonuclease HI
MKVGLSIVSPLTFTDRLTKWNNNYHSSIILNVDGSCLGSPIRAGYGGVLRNNAGFYLSGFSGHIQHSSEILHAELFAIYKGMMLAKKMDISELVCYSDSLHGINLIKGPNMMFDVYDVLIQDIKDLIQQSNVTICHTLREENQCVELMAKLGVSSDIELLLCDSPPTYLLSLLKIDVADTLFSRK